MKAAIIALAAMACVACADPLIKHVMDAPAHVYEHRPRLGHFKDKPYIDLYKLYARVFVQPNHPERDDDDYRMFLPAAFECMQFLQSFRTSKYKLRKVEDIVILDACLGYLYDDGQDTYHKRDSEEQSEVVSMKKINNFREDDNLSKLYRGTTIELMSPEAMACVANLMASAIPMRGFKPTRQCSSDWLQLYIQFAECHHNIPSYLRKEDTYVPIIYELVKEETQECFNSELFTLQEKVREHYRSGYTNRIGNSITSIFSKNSLGLQQRNRMWPSPVVELLAAVQGAKTQVSLRQVHQLLRGYYNNDATLTEAFLNNISSYAKKVIKINDKKAAQTDPLGSRRYKEKVVDSLCNWFRSSDNPKIYDFSMTFIRFVQLLNHQDVFQITYKYFLERLLVYAEEAASMYLSISSCNILTFTEGQIITPLKGRELDFKVNFVADTSDMVQWPDAGYY